MSEPSTVRPFTSTGPQGHRARMRERLLGRGPAALADYELLEMLLFLGIPRRDTKPLAKELINRFGSLEAVLGATADRLGAAGLRPEAASVLRVPEEAARRLAMAEARDRPVLNNWDRLLEYFDTALSGAVPGQRRALLLDNRNRLLADETLPDMEVGALAGILARRALELHATALILLRVVPPGPVPAALVKAEGGMVRELGAPLAALAVMLHDHMLVGGGSWVSLKQKGYL
ncbi:JAB domain-containing protein [Rhizosaccharibacter radicis]|uniref:DNA repair protein RadC n=1 Tax=Rhizosaccharibacter radicis TaxID=2782605 RepID=A0ABT1VYC2_9PROT|nr:DNA repair protein RadC [Acetobacteraceae bacterium KSS12]